MLLGLGNGCNYHIDPKAFPRAGYWGFFVQDDWKVTRKLTLNLGLRYEFDVPRTEVQNRYSYWDLNAPSPIRFPATTLKGVYKFVDNNTRSPFDADHNNFAPRLGFAYALNDKTSIRAGAGIFYPLSRATVAGHTGVALQHRFGACRGRWTAAPRSMPRCRIRIRRALLSPRAARSAIRRSSDSASARSRGTEPQSADVLVECLAAARSRLELGRSRSTTRAAAACISTIRTPA